MIEPNCWGSSPLLRPRIPNQGGAALLKSRSGSAPSEREADDFCAGPLGARPLALGRLGFPVQILGLDLGVSLELLPVSMAADQRYLFDGIAGLEQPRHALMPKVVEA